MITHLQAQRQSRQTPASALTPARPGLLQRACACGGSPGVDGECPACRAKRLGVQRQAASQSTPAAVPPIVQEVLRSPGQPLNAATRAFMEPRFGHDFSQVRVHTDARAAESARSMNALAYTVGRNVVFGTGEYAPGTSAGRSIIAHELTHVVQQQASSASAPQHFSISSPADTSEREAAAAAQAIMTGNLVGTVSNATSGSSLQRIFGIKLPSGARPLTSAEVGIVRPVYGSSLDFSKIAISDALGGGGRPFTVYIPLVGTVINAGPSAYATPGSAPSLLIHELAHSWQSQHAGNPAAYMGNSLASQAGAGAAGGDAYCYIPGKPFGDYAAEQIAQQVENGVAPIIAHIASVGAGARDPENERSLLLPRWETRGAPGVIC